MSIIKAKYFHFIRYNIMTIELYTPEDLHLIYDNINTNYHVIYNNYYDILDENKNSVTRNFISEGYNKTTAYKLSFMFTFLISVELNSS